MQKRAIIPNLITTFGLACGLFVIFRVNMAGDRTFALMQTMTYILLLAAFADVLDGAVARAVRGESDFGLEFDSLSDAITFGVAPSALFLSSIFFSDESVVAFFAICSALIYTICGVLRLVRFNITQAVDKEERGKAFVGLPIPAAAMAFISPNLFFHAPFFTSRYSLDLVARAWIMSAIAIVLAYLMLSRIRFSSAKSFNIRLRSFETVFISMLCIIIFLYGLIYNLAALLFISSWGYILFSLVLAPFRKKLKD